MAIANLEREEYLGAVRKDSIVSISLEHQVLSKYTAFLAWDGSAPNLLYKSTVNYSISTPGGTLTTEIRRGEIRKPSIVGADFRLVRDGGGWSLDVGSAAGGTEVRVVDLRGNVLWTGRAAGGGQSLSLPQRLPSFVMVQVRTGAGWRGRTLPAI